VSNRQGAKPPTYQISFWRLGDAGYVAVTLAEAAKLIG
jgi:hypothetical protein